MVYTAFKINFYRTGIGELNPQTKWTAGQILPMGFYGVAVCYCVAQPVGLHVNSDMSDDG
jgi:hypothetical protein